MSSSLPPGAREPVLSEQALDRLRELDPTGQGRLLDRVFAAFESSAAKLMPQLDQAQAAQDLGGIRFVAHTLKSSSASIGALRLSRRCAHIEDMVNHHASDALPAELDAMRGEMLEVLSDLRERRSMPT